MMYDVAVIGGGVLGCFAARSLGRWKLKTLLLEAKADVCTGITRANAAICYAGYDHAPASAKATFTLTANAAMDALCDDLEVPFIRRGSLMAAYGPRGEAVLQKKLANGRCKGVPGLKLLTGEEAREREPMLSQTVTAALYCPTTGTVNPWLFGIAAFENALHNGCTPMLNTQVLDISRDGEGYVLQTGGEEVHCRMVLNCGGLYADRISEMLFSPRVRLYPDASDFMVFDRDMETPSHILFQETEQKGKGITAVPTTEGNLMLASAARALSGEAFSTDRRSLLAMEESASALLPYLDFNAVIRCFGAVRPNPRRMSFRDGQWAPEEEKISSFVIDRTEPGFVSLIGVKTPGLTCADQLGTHLAGLCAEYLQAQANPGFNPKRTAIVRLHSMDNASRAALAARNGEFGKIVCQCEDISEGEIREAISRGATTAEGVKRRVGTGMGSCQGGRCTREIQRLLGEQDYGNG